jgi:hypothetical protein
MSNKWLFFAIVIFFLVSCRQVHEIIIPEVEFSITSPKQGWTYYDDSKILLAVNVDTEDIVWDSSAAGYLGTGNHLAVFLPEGIHSISAEIQNKKVALYIQINKRTDNDEQDRKILINSPYAK